jgi:hypothetical protein
MSATRLFPGIGFDPAPGDVTQLEALALTLHRTARRLAEADRLLSSAGRAYGSWTGPAAEEFAQRIGPLPERVRRATVSYGDVARAVAHFAGCVAGLQREARLVEQDALDARRRFDAAGADTESAQLEAVRDDLRRAVARARSVAERHGAAAARVVAAIDAAGEPALSDPGLARRLDAAVTGMVRSAWAAYDGLVTKAAPAIKLLADSCGAVAAVLGLASLVPGLQVLAAPSAVLGGAALLGHVALATTGNGGWTDVALDAGGLASFRLGLRLAAASTKAEKAAEGARGTLRDARRVEAVARDTGRHVARAAVKIRAETFAAMTAAEQRAMTRAAALTQHKLADATLGGGGVVGFAKAFPENRPTYGRGAGQLRHVVGRGLSAFSRLEVHPA